MRRHLAGVLQAFDHKLAAANGKIDHAAEPSADAFTGSQIARNPFEQIARVRWIGKEK